MSLIMLKGQGANQGRRFRRQYVQGAVFQYLGEDITLNLLPSSSEKHCQVERVDDRLDVSLTCN